MSVEDPFFETSGGKRSEILSNISSMPDDDKEKYSYIWMAELGKDTNPAQVVQFDTRGNEINYGEVRKQLNQNNVTGLYWVPVKANRKGFGVKTSDLQAMPELLRRGYIMHSGTGLVTRKGFAYRIEADGKYLYISDSGETLVNQDEELNVVDAFNIQTQ